MGYRDFAEGLARIVKREGRSSLLGQALILAASFLN